MFEHEPPEVVFHYTRQEGMLGILNEHALRATDIRFLNDELEYQYTLRLVNARLADKAFMAEFDDVPELNATWEEAFRIVHGIRVYAASFSELPDDLTQWRAYCSGGGYALGFLGETLRRPAIGSIPSFLFRCEYDVKKQTDRIDAALRRMAEYHRLYGPTTESAQPAAAYGATFVGHISMLAAVFKHPSFMSEREWRLVLRTTTPRPPGADLLHFRVGRRNIVPYLTVPFDCSYVRWVYIGPAPHARTAHDATMDLLESKGYNSAKVHSSEIPYRDS